MLVPAAMLWRMASSPLWKYVPSPRLANTCWSVVNGAWPTQVTPSPPICVKVEVLRSHPVGHVVAADARHSARTLGHAGAGVVRAAAAEPRGAFARVHLQLRHRAFAGLDDGNARIHARDDVARYAQLLQALGNRLGDDGGRQVGLGAQQPVLAGVGHA